MSASDLQYIMTIWGVVSFLGLVTLGVMFWVARDTARRLRRVTQAARHARDEIRGQRYSHGTSGDATWDYETQVYWAQVESVLTEAIDPRTHKPSRIRVGRAS